MGLGDDYNSAFYSTIPTSMSLSDVMGETIGVMPARLS